MAIRQLFLSRFRLITLREGSLSVDHIRKEEGIAVTGTHVKSPLKMNTRSLWEKTQKGASHPNVETITALTICALLPWRRKPSKLKSKLGEQMATKHNSEVMGKILLWKQKS